MDSTEIVGALTAAIADRRIVRLGYSRLQRGAMLTLHYIAPIDIRPGESEATRGILYLWAYCFDQSRLETHLLGRVRSVTPSDEVFDPDLIMRLWPTDRWPVPPDWVVPRDWSR